jgi:IS30 family transposase
MKHFTHGERYEIKALLSQQLSYRAIGKQMHKAASTISREIIRGGGRTGYTPERSQENYFFRRQRSPYKFDSLMQEAITHALELQYSPEQITESRKKHHQATVSHERIYQFVYQNKAYGGELFRHLRWHQKQRKKRTASKDKRGCIPNRRSIDERPVIVATKERFGDFEGDTIVGKHHRKAVVVLTERKSKLTLMKKVEDRTAESVTSAIVELLAASPIRAHTLTVDNGKEFALHQQLAHDAKLDVFFAHPYHSWERGLNENTNGLIRQYFPKSTAFATVSDDQVAFVQQRLNTRPRKTLCFDSPLDFFSNSLKLSTVASQT